jgi:hypothetical protein
MVPNKNLKFNRYVFACVYWHIWYIVDFFLSYKRILFYVNSAKSFFVEVKKKKIRSINV